MYEFKKLLKWVVLHGILNVVVPIHRTNKKILTDKILSGTVHFVVKREKR